MSFLIKVEKFNYYVLTSEDRDEALHLVATAFLTEPSTKSVEHIPELRVTYEDWVEFYGYYIDECCSNKISVCAKDNDSGRMAGVLLGNDFLYSPEGFAEKYNDNHRLSPVMHFEAFQEENGARIRPELKVPGNSTYIPTLAVHPDFRRKKIANNLIGAVLPLMKKAGYKYATMDSSNYYTAMAAKFNKFEEVFTTPAKDWLWKGKPFFTNIEPPHDVWRLWARNLDDL